MKAVYIYTGKEGHSKFKKGSLVNDSLVKTAITHFKETPAFSNYDWHNAPRTQFVITLKGILEFTMNSGESFIIHPGDVLIANDLTGSGHKWKLINEEPWQRVYCVFDEPLELDKFFIEQN